MLLVICIAVVLQVTPAWSDGTGIVHVSNIAPADPQRIRRYYRDYSKYLIPGYAIVLEGSFNQILKLSSWLDSIYGLPHGQSVLDSVNESGNTLTIRHSEWALTASGRTQAPVSFHLTDGLGEDTLILFDTRIPDDGSHVVFNSSYEPIAFNAVQNLFHELAHAKHYTNGTWRYFDSEGQAIEEENIFRAEMAFLAGVDNIAYRATKRGKQIWWPDSLE